MKKLDPELSKGWGHIVTHLSVKQWMAQVASQRIDQMQDPELSINQAIVDYQRLGYSVTPCLSLCDVDYQRLGYSVTPCLSLCDAAMSLCDVDTPAGPY